MGRETIIRQADTRQRGEKTGMTKRHGENGEKPQSGKQVVAKQAAGSLYQEKIVVSQRLSLYSARTFVGECVLNLQDSAAAEGAMTRKRSGERTAKSGRTLFLPVTLESWPGYVKITRPTEGANMITVTGAVRHRVVTRIMQSLR